MTAPCGCLLRGQRALLPVLPARGRPEMPVGWSAGLDTAFAVAPTGHVIVTNWPGALAGGIRVHPRGTFATSTAAILVTAGSVPP